MQIRFELKEPLLSAVFRKMNQKKSTSARAVVIEVLEESLLGKVKSKHLAKSK